jgi:BirA family transcriptional regulator, biotin operon repressor / biotin---[acetyl-CoA-carboxylase] ligase
MSPAMRTPAAVRWGAEALWQELNSLLPGLSVEIVASCDSTNTQLVERARRSSGLGDAQPSRPGELEPPISGPIPLTGETPLGRRAGDTQPCLLVAEAQTRGRGRLGRSWQSAEGASLTFSLALPLDPPDWSGLSLAVGVALAEALDARHDAAGPRVALKWPNDLMWCDGQGAPRKLGGILIETVPVGRRRMAVIGIGLNIMPMAVSDLSHGYAHLQEVVPGIDAPAALWRIAAPLLVALRTFEHGGGFAPFKARFEQRDVLAGQRVHGGGDDGIDGVALGIDEQRALRVQVGDEVHLLSSGDVSVRAAADDGDTRC